MHYKLDPNFGFLLTQEGTLIIAQLCEEACEKLSRSDDVFGQLHYVNQAVNRILPSQEIKELQQLSDSVRMNDPRFVMIKIAFLTMLAYYNNAYLF